METNFLKQLGNYMVLGARYHAQWELDVSNRILGDRKRMFVLLLLLVPAVLGGIAFADEVGGALPNMIGGKSSYSPAFYSTTIFIASIVIGVMAGLITGCIGAGGGFIIAPALMSAGIKGILAVGTDLFHIFAKAIMGSVIHRKLGNVSVPLAVVFLIGAIIGATCGGIINRCALRHQPGPQRRLHHDHLLAHARVPGLLCPDRLPEGPQAPPAEDGCSQGQARPPTMAARWKGRRWAACRSRLQAVKIPPIVRFDHDFTPGGRGISWIFLVFSGALVGLAAGIMGVGGGFLTFPIFVYVLGVSSMTTVGTDIFQIIFTAGWSAVTQYAIYGFIFYTLAMGMLLGSLLGIQIGAMVDQGRARASRSAGFTPWRCWPVL